MKNYQKYKKTKAWFSIIELLVWIFIFSLWLISVYAVLISTLKLNDYNKNYIIAANLAREQIELFRNIRDSNYNSLHKYNQINPNWSYASVDDFFWTRSYYKIENNFSSLATFPVLVDKIDPFWEGESEISWKMKSYRLCLDTKWRYKSVDSSSFDCLSGEQITNFYRFIEIEGLKYNSGWTIETIDNALKIKSKVIWNIRWYHEFQIDTIISDWKRL